MAIKLAAMRCRCQGSKAQICKINYKLRSEFVSWPVASIGKYIRVQEIFVQVAEFASSLIGWRNQLAQNMAINMHETANKNQIINNQSFVLLPADFPRPKKEWIANILSLNFIWSSSASTAYAICIVCIIVKDSFVLQIYRYV